MKCCLIGATLGEPMVVLIKTWPETNTVLFVFPLQRAMKKEKFDNVATWQAFSKFSTAFFGSGIPLRFNPGSLSGRRI